MPLAPDDIDAELNTVRALLKQRYKENVELHLVDAELYLGPDTIDFIKCPAALVETSTSETH